MALHATVRAALVVAVTGCTDAALSPMTAPVEEARLPDRQSQEGVAVFSDATDRLAEVIEDPATRRELQDQLRQLATAMESGRPESVRLALRSVESALTQVRETPDNQPDLQVIRESIADARTSLDKRLTTTGGTPR